MNDVSLLKNRAHSIKQEAVYCALRSDKNKFFFVTV